MQRYSMGDLAEAFTILEKCSCYEFTISPINETFELNSNYKPCSKVLFSFENCSIREFTIAEEARLKELGWRSYEDNNVWELIVT